MPEPTKIDCLLAKYEMGLAEEAMATIQSIPEGHRSQEFSRLLIPRCPPIVQGIGNRMVYETALVAGVENELIDLFEVGVIKQNLSWYIEAGLLTRSRVREMENRALDAVQSRAEELIDKLDIAPYVTAPIAKESTWESFMQDLPTFTGEAEFPLYGAIQGENSINDHAVVDGDDVANSTDGTNCLVNGYGHINGVGTFSPPAVFNGNGMLDRIEAVENGVTPNGVTPNGHSVIVADDNLSGSDTVTDGDIVPDGKYMNGDNFIEGTAGIYDEHLHLQTGALTEKVSI